MRRNLVAGNWKMNGSQAFAAQLCAQIARAVESADDSAAESADTPDIVLCPPNILLASARDALAASRVQLGAQDVDANDNGAFTGQTSARQLADSGCRYVIVGHSERRTLYGETDADVANKTLAALAFGLRPIVCLGETQAERDAGVTEDVLGRQLDAVLAAVAAASADFSAAVIAYEPVWAIGSGATASPAQAQKAHHFIRARLAAAAVADADAAECRILYGGSMKPDNAAELMAQPDIDGGLIGGAALNAPDFTAICHAAGLG